MDDPEKQRKVVIGSRHAEEVARLEYLLVRGELKVIEDVVLKRVCYFCGYVTGGKMYALRETRDGYPHWIGNDCYERVLERAQRSRDYMN